MPREIKRLTVDKTLTTNIEGWAGNDLYFLSCMMRIADATETTAANYNSMKADKEYYEKRYREEQAENEKLRASNASLRGVITRMKNKERKQTQAGP